MPTQVEINSLIAGEHPEYKDMLAHWQFLDETYRGGRGWFEKHIFKYFKEGDAEFKARKTRAYRFNHTREVVDLINKYLFRKPADRREQDAPESVRKFWKNVDGSGMNIEEFARTVSAKASTSGCPWVIVDSTARAIDKNTSEKDTEDARIYAYIVRPDQVKDLSWGDDGKLNWILVEETFRDDQDPFNCTGEVKTQYRLWTRDDWYLIKPKEKASDKKKASPNSVENGVHRGSNGSANEALVRNVDYEIVDNDEHGLGMVPAIRADNTPSDALWTVPALINDIAYLDRAVANYLSNLDAIIQDQTFSQLAIPAQNLMPGEEGHNKILEMGTKRIFTYDGEGGAQPFFLSPDPKQAELIISAIQQIINEIYHSVGLAGERTKQDNSKGIDNSSGVAKAKDFERVNSLLMAKAQAMQSFELELIKVVAAFGGHQDSLSEDRELVRYPDSFDVVGLFDEIDIAMKLSLIDAPAVMRARQMNKVSEKLFRSASEKFVKEVESEIDRWKERLEERTDLDMEALTNSTKDAQSRLTEEAKRDRSGSGRKQSNTKSRQENRRSESDRETGQE